MRHEKLYGPVPPEGAITWGVADAELGEGEVTGDFSEKPAGERFGGGFDKVAVAAGKLVLTDGVGAIKRVGETEGLCAGARPGSGDGEEVGLGDGEEVGLGDGEEAGLGDGEEVGLG
ncbi:MAG: hypothetical protein WA376_15510, partial [Terrimicrobiaceae bacterium]